MRIFHHELLGAHPHLKPMIQVPDTKCWVDHYSRPTTTAGLPLPSTLYPPLSTFYPPSPPFTPPLHPLPTRTSGSGVGAATPPEKKEKGEFLRSLRIPEPGPALNPQPNPNQQQR